MAKPRFAGDAGIMGIISESIHSNDLVWGSILASTLWYAGLVKPPADETTGEEFCSIDNVVAGGMDAGETMSPSCNNIECRFSADILMTGSGVAGVESSSNGLEGLGGGAGL